MIPTSVQVSGRRARGVLLPSSPPRLRLGPERPGTHSALARLRLPREGDQIRREDAATNHICIGPINKVLNTVVWHVARPGAWNDEERDRFIDIIRRQNRPVYLLDDGAETNAARRQLMRRYTFRKVAVLDVPLFGDVDDTPGALWEINPP